MRIVAFKFSTHPSEQSLSMVTRMLRLLYHSAPISKEGSQQNCRFHLSTGYRHGVSYTIESLTPDSQRSKGVFATPINFSTHQTKWLNQPPHRPRAKRDITSKYGKEWLGSKHTTEKTHGCSTIDSIENILSFG